LNALRNNVRISLNDFMALVLASGQFGERLDEEAAGATGGIQEILSLLTSLQQDLEAN
jgi:hypothetical protein